MSVNIKPLEDRIVVKTLEAEQTTASGLVIPDTAKEKPQEGEVLAIGPGRIDDNGNRVPLDVAVGDKVIYSKYGGTEVKYAGEEYLILWLGAHLLPRRSDGRLPRTDLGGRARRLARSHRDRHRVLDGPALRHPGLRRQPAARARMGRPEHPVLCRALRPLARPFTETVDELFEGPVAELAKARATKIAPAFGGCSRARRCIRKHSRRGVVAAAATGPDDRRRRWFSGGVTRRGRARRGARRRRRRPGASCRS